MTPKQQYHELMAAAVIRQLQKRQMAGYYAPTREEAVTRALSLMAPGTSVGWGGSQTLLQSGLMQALHSHPYELIDRASAQSPEEVKEIKRRLITCDTFLMSTNAITLDGLLINIDGYGSRVAYLCHGPEQVIILAGMNKMAVDLEEGIKRARNFAAVPNNIRLEKGTPCTKNGKCSNCLDARTICCQFVVTRFSAVKDRIKVILVGEDLGY